MSEIIGVLFKYLLVIIAIGAVVSIFYEAMSTSNTSMATNDLTQIQQNIYELSSGESGINQITTPSDLINSGVLPTSMLSSASSTRIIDPWGGVVQVAAKTPSESVTSLVFPNVPLSACTKLTVSAAQAGISIIFGASTIYPSDQNLVSDAAQACTSTNSSTLSMTFTFYPDNVASSTASSQSEPQT